MPSVSREPARSLGYGRHFGKKGALVPLTFKVVPRRWVVETTFGWMIRWRRLVRDYEARIDVSGGMIQLAMASLLLRRVCH
ncbi:MULTISPECIES: transposase [unclassified Azospirillum]|uniref:transposase n=1 Tax=unclassified Azospirillum TaxID=2630922 RepID=UPI0024947DC5|nr:MULTISPECIES: transposase [unclassified Azospirillum]